MSQRSVRLWAAKMAPKMDDGRITNAWRQTSILFALVLALTSGPLAAQDSRWIGERVRLVRVDGKKFPGTLAHLTPETVQILRDAKAPLTIDRSQIVRVERSLGRKHDFGQFFLLGAVASMGAGVFLQFTADPGDGASFAILGGVIWAVPVGVLAGTLLKGEAWEPIGFPVPSEFSFSGFPDGRFGLSKSVQVSW